MDTAMTKEDILRASRIEVTETALASKVIVLKSGQQIYFANEEAIVPSEDVERFGLSPNAFIVVMRDGVAVGWTELKEMEIAYPA